MNTRRAVNDLAQYRRRKGITQETIARRMGVCKQAVTRQSPPSTAKASTPDRMSTSPQEQSTNG